MYLLIFLFAIFLTPELSYAWGPLTHAYLAQQVLNLPNLLPLSLVTLLSKYREHFIYGNIVPDTILGKKYLPEDRNPHSWKLGFNLLNEAKADEEKAFAYGYLAHLASDAILHSEIRQLNPLQHMIFELRADSAVDRIYWLKIVTISKRVRKVGDRFFEQNLETPSFPLKTSRRIYNSLLFLSAFNRGERENLETFRPFHLKSLSAVVDLFRRGESSQVLKLSPNG